MAVEIFMPKLSDNMEVGEIVEWLVKEGSAVEKGQPILSLITDKAIVDLEAPTSGVLKGIRPGVQPGAQVPVGETIAFIASPDESVSTLPPLGNSVLDATKQATSTVAVVEPAREEEVPVARRQLSVVLPKNWE